MAGCACSTFDPATVLRGAVTRIAAVSHGSAVFAVTLFGTVVRWRVSMLSMGRGNVHLRQHERLRLMARAKRRNSHRLHAERQAQ